ncbi:MAG: YlmH/Sll1252 family protein [Eubacteriales bacterium]|nr:YlmH/Sll1252 family protein [Eubacteriales bacterium]MDD3214688.1 YlmH/Sll1252 family protein [Eubacteriales bacterium]
MSRTQEAPLPFSRLLELAEQADRQQRVRFTPFLTPPEAELAQAAAKRAGVAVTLNGGYPDAERQMARFVPMGEAPEPFPITALAICWPRQKAPEHRDLLGAVMALGIRRDRLGDIALSADGAWLFAETSLAEQIANGLQEAGRVKLTVNVTEGLPLLAAPTGEERRCTVQSPRLDAVVAEGFQLSRGAAADLIAAGAVKLRHMLTLRADARVEAGDAISVRGYGRLRIDTFGDPTRKGRLPILMTRFGASR